MEDKKLSNDDFRNLLNQSTTTNSNTHTHNKKNKKKKSSWLDRDYEYYQNAPEKIDANYKDRARERRKGGDDENNNEDNTSGITTIKKGLDFDLLYSTKEQLRLEQLQQQQLAGGEDNDSNKEEIEKQVKKQNKLTSIKCQTSLGNSIVKSLLARSGGSGNQVQHTIDKQSKAKQQQHNKEIYQTSRMLYLFDLDPDFPQHIPTTILNSKEDCPPVKHSLSGRVVDNTTLKKITHYYHPEKKLVFVNEKNDNNNIDSENEDNINNNNNGNIKEKEKEKVIIKVQQQDDSDSDDNIFSDTEEYVCEPKSKSTTTTTTKSSNSNYFNSKDDDYSDEFKPIGKENDEYVNNNSNNEEEEDKDTKIFINKNGEIVSRKEQQIRNINSEEEKDDDDEEEKDNYNVQNNQELDDDDEYAYPNTDDNYKRHDMKQTSLYDDGDEKDIGYDDGNGSDGGLDDEEGLFDLMVPKEDVGTMKVGTFKRLDEDEESTTAGPQYNDSSDSEEEEEYVYPNTDEKFEQHEKDYRKEQDNRFNEVNSDDSSSEEDNIISLDTTNEALKRKLLDSGADDYDNYSSRFEYSGFDRERGEKPKLSIDEMYKFKKERPTKKPKTENQKLGQQMQKINNILKSKSKETGEKFHDILGDGNKKNNNNKK